MKKISSLLTLNQLEEKVSPDSPKTTNPKWTSMPKLLPPTTKVTSLLKVGEDLYRMLTVLANIILFPTYLLNSPKTSLTLTPMTILNMDMPLMPKSYVSVMLTE